VLSEAQGSLFIGCISLKVLKRYSPYKILRITKPNAKKNKICSKNANANALTVIIRKHIKI